MGDKGQKKIEKKDAEKIQEKKPVKKRAATIVRIMSVDLDGSFSIYNALRNVKGISFRAAAAILTNVGIDSKIKLGELKPEQIKSIEEEAKNAKFPVWMKNRSGQHIVMTDIDLNKRNDINLLQKTRAYRGIRHERGLPTRGQRTRGAFRKNKTVGVVKKKAMQAKSGKK